SDDVFGRNPGVIVGAAGAVTFKSGEIGKAFTFNGAGHMRVPASPSLDLGAGNGFTIEAWIKPNDVSTAQPILEWNSGYSTGVALWLSDLGFLTADIPDSFLIDNVLSGWPQLTAGTFQHVALTYDNTDFTARLYLNGVEAGQVGCFLLTPPQTTSDLYVGF